MSRRAQAQRSVLSAVAFVLALHLGMGILSEKYTRIRDPLFGDKFVKLKKRIDTRPGPVIVMLGSSRTGLAFHGKVVEERIQSATGQTAVAFNFGIPASGPITHTLYWNRMQKQGTPCDLLLIEVLPSMLSAGPVTPLERHWLTGDRLTHAELPLAVECGLDEKSLHHDWQMATFLPWYTLRFPLLSRVVQSWIPWQYRCDWSRSADECGWGRIERETITAEERAGATFRAMAEYAPTLKSLKIGGGAVHALRTLLTNCRERGIEVRLVLMPEGSEFRSWYAASVSQSVEHFLSDLCLEFDCDWIDARLWLEDDQFTDGHHMLASGSQRFSERLTEEYLIPQLATKGRSHD